MPSLLELDHAQTVNMIDGVHHAQTVNMIDGDLLDAGSLLLALRIFEQTSQSASIVSKLAFRSVKNSVSTSRGS